MAERAARPPVDWVVVRAEYEANEDTIVAICRRHHTSNVTLHKHRVAEGWTRRTNRHVVDRGAIIARMFHLLDRQIIQLEQDMTRTGEKEVAVLGKLASTLEKLIDIDRAEKADRPKSDKSKEMMVLRNKLAERIEQLKRA